MNDKAAHLPQSARRRPEEFSNVFGFHRSTNATLSDQDDIDTSDALEYFQKNSDNNSNLGSLYPSLYEDALGKTRQSDVRRLQKILAGANGGWQRFFAVAASASPANDEMIFSKERTITLDEAGAHKVVPALYTVAEVMESRLDALIGNAWISRPQRVEAAHNALKNIIAYAPNWGDTMPDGNLALSYIQFACGLSHIVISDISLTRPITDRLSNAIARCAALEVLKDYLLRKINGYQVWLETPHEGPRTHSERKVVENKAKNATATAMLVDRALDVARMRVHVFKGMELAQSLANLKQSILRQLERGNMRPSSREKAFYRVQLIDVIISQAANATVPCSVNCTTNIVHDKAGHLEDITFGGDEIRRHLAKIAMDYGYRALALQLDNKRYTPSSRHVPRKTQFLPSSLPSDLMELT